MKKNLSLIFQIAAVFIGTIVGAGLASGQEIKQFFTYYGYKSFIGIIVCFFIYVLVSPIITKISLRYKLTSYRELITLVSPGFLGEVTDIITSFFLITGCGIILAGSGAILCEYFKISKWVGIILMAVFSILTLLRNTKGLIEINSFIVPCLITVITTIFIIYLVFDRKAFNFTYIKEIPHVKDNWLLSCLIYGSFNLLCCCGVLVPLCTELHDNKSLNKGVFLGALGLTVLTIMINLLLMVNIPGIYSFEIPLLYVAKSLGRILQIILIAIILLEMFSTEVSDAYSVAKTLEKSLKLSYKKSIFLIIFAAIPISQIGFSNLITVIFPAFGAISFIFIIQCVIFYYKKYKDINL